MDYYRTRLFLALTGLVLAIVWVLPNFTHPKKWITDNRLNYGLDIQGGIQLVMGVDVLGVVSETTIRQSRSLEAEFAKENIQATITTPKASEGELEVTSSQMDKVRAYIEKNHSTLLQVFASEGNDKVTLKYLDAYLTDYKSKIIGQAIETIRNRIDEFGVSEPSISAQGSDRILVQLPGMSDAERAKELINTTAKLDFMLVDGEVSPDKISQLVADAEKAGNYSLATLKYSEYVDRLNKDLAGKIPANTAVYFEKRENSQKMETGSMPLLLKTDTGLGGGDLDSAAVTFGQYGEPQVSLNFNPAGANKFSDLTGNNIGKRMAIVLDRVVKSAPNIQSKIPTGSAVITLGNTGGRDNVVREAQMIATALRAGALPARLEQLEERRVGPTLGSDSIQKAATGALVGAGLIFLFLIVYYRAMGLVAATSIAVNILCLIGLLAAFGATLTLPGIAGIALTVGFAVDANVLIQERIKEELAKGASWMAAMKEGYSLAMTAIIDSNITVGATAVILFYFGTGPVRGFAVTLMLGIVTTLFGNVFFSKVIADTLVYKLGIKKLSI